MTWSSRLARRARPALGTIVEMRAAGVPVSAHAFDRAFAAVERVHSLMSRQKRDSDVARINRALPGTLTTIDPWTFDVLRRAKELHAATDGLFDCAASPSRGGTLRDLEIVARRGVMLHRRLELTLDGIAKGYAVDRAVDALRAHGITTGAVNAGGDLRVFGEEPQP